MKRSVVLGDMATEIEVDAPLLIKVGEAWINPAKIVRIRPAVGKPHESMIIFDFGIQQPDDRDVDTLVRDITHAMEDALQ